MARFVIEVRDLHKSFGEQHVLRGVDLHAEEAENLIVFGRSGSGKSVLLKCLIGLMTPDAGKALVNGEAIYELPDREASERLKTVGFLYQSGALFDSMSVRENLEFPLVKNFGVEDPELTERVERALERVSLADAIDKTPAELSGGMRKRVALAREIVVEPRVMFYDEPTTGLDPITSKEISMLVRKLQEELKMTSIVVTHDLVCARIVEDRTVILRGGEAAHEGKIEELERSDDPFLKNFFSSEFHEEYAESV
jgi:phospholipid/cholesterol/gamma-HCH transport system ATP-binding protein